MRRPPTERIARKFIRKFLAGEHTRDVSIGNLAEKKAQNRGFRVGGIR
jgi:hypothetical protein